MTGAPDIALIPQQLQAFYSAGFGYYATLSERHKALFVSRCLQFISEKDIAGAGGFVPDNRAKALVAASAVQLTLGLDTWSLDYFEAIVIYPGVFDNAAGTLKYKGETNIAGFIKLSWKSFAHGYMNASDNINLGLHEFSHALRFNSIRGAEQDYFLEHYFNSWLASAYEAYNDIRAGRSTIFRKYGGANINEFISVCIEHFFESPEEIKRRYPGLYYSTAVLLNQETVGAGTRIGVREELLQKKNALLPGFSRHRQSSSLLKSPFFKTLLFLGPLLLLLIAGSGIGNGFSLFFLAWLGVSYLRFDYRFVSLLMEGRTVTVKKGLYVFGFRSSSSIPVSCLVSCRRKRVLGPVTEWQTVFYNPGNTYFYEETTYAPTPANDKFTMELLRNKIASLR